MGYRNYGPANGFIVSKDGNGDFTTIGAALTAATSGTTVFIKPGTYTENLALKSGVSLVAFCSSYGTTSPVIIVGDATLSSGIVNIQDITFKTNSTFIFTISGSATINALRCNFVPSSNAFSCSNGSINFLDCNLIDAGSGSGAWFTCSNTSVILLIGSYFTGSTSTASTFTNTSALTIRNSTFQSFLTMSLTSQFLAYNSVLGLSTNNAIFLTTSGTTSTNEIANSYIYSGTTSALSIGSGTTLTLSNTIINSSNTNAITGAGTLQSYSNIFSGTSHQTNVTTQTGGVAAGLTQGTAPSAGYIGEQITSSFTSQAPSNNTATSFANLSLTAGIWDISASGFVVTGSNYQNFSVGISTVNNTLQGNAGDQQSVDAEVVATAVDRTLCVPVFRATLSATTIYYHVVKVGVASGTISCNGRITATRVG